MKRSLVFLCFSFYLIAVDGCMSSQPQPGVTFTLCAITKDKGGKAIPQGTPLKVDSVLVDDVEDVSSDGGAIQVLVRKTQYAKATFEVTFPNHPSQNVQVKSGEAKDIFPKGGKLGVRIEVLEAR